MIEERHIQKAIKLYFKDKKGFRKKIPQFKGLSDKEIINELADMYAWSEKRLKELNEKLKKNETW